MKKKIILLLFLFVLLSAFKIDTLRIPYPPPQLEKLSSNTLVNLHVLANKWINGIIDNRHANYFEMREYIGYHILFSNSIFSDWPKDLQLLGKIDFKKYASDDPYDMILASTTIRNKFIYKIFNNPKLLKLTYNWLIPVFKDILDEDLILKATFKKISDHLLIYCEYFSLDDEKKYYMQCLTDNEPWRFVFESYDLNADPDYRRLETWVFRRVNNGDFTIDEIEVILLDIKKDIDL